MFLPVTKSDWLRPVLMRVVLIHIVMTAIVFLMGNTSLRAADLSLDSGAAGLYLKLKRLQSPVTVLHVVAHPDDEDGGMLAYCARELGLRTLLFCLTRGEGGANRISDHFFDELGALRTLEHAKAASYYGNELFYSQAADYGYSKTLQEAMQKWENGVPLLEQLVAVIRRHRPTILLSRFTGDSRDGHGHHQLAGMLSRLAYEAAADSRQFPHQVNAGLQPHRIAKFYVRAGSPWRPPADGEWTVQLPIGKYNPMLGASPQQIARFGLGYQRSQGFSGHASDPGPAFSYYRLEASETSPAKQQEQTLLDQLDTSWSGLVSAKEHPESHERLRSLDRHVNRIFESWDPRTPQKTLDELIAIPPTDWMKSQGLQHAYEQWNRYHRAAIIAASGIDIQAWCVGTEGQRKGQENGQDRAQEINFVVPGETIAIHTRITNQGSVPLFLESLEIRIPRPDRASDNVDSRQIAAKAVAAGETMEFETILRLPLETPLSRPRWFRSELTTPLYRVDSRAATRQANFQVIPEIRIRDEDGFVLRPVREIQVRRKDPKLGNVRYPLSVVSAKNVRFARKHRVVPLGKQVFQATVTVGNSTKTPSQAVVRLDTPAGWQCKPTFQTIDFQREDEQRSVAFEISIPDDIQAVPYELTARVQSPEGEFREGFETVTARDLGRINVYHPARQRIQVADVRIRGNPKVGYVMGSGDRVAESLASLDVYPEMLSEADLATGDHSRYDLILIGVRAYAVREDLRKHNARLLEYVKQGGTLIVQYQTPEFDKNYGPYPYSMGRNPEEVSEEDARVSLLRANHPLFQVPNKISSSDFDGWFEQRGSKFWASWDERYTPLLECHDSGQPPQTGGQLIASYGKGTYVYTALSWYRQLPQGIPGPYRLFANLLSLPETMRLRPDNAHYPNIRVLATMPDSLTHGLRKPNDFP